MSPLLSVELRGRGRYCISRASAIVFVSAFVLIMLHYEPPSIDLSQSSSSTALLASTGEMTELYYVYPNASLSELRNASLLAEDLFSRVGERTNGTQYVDPTATSGPVQLLFRAPPDQGYFDGFLQGYQVVGFSYQVVGFSSFNGSILKIFYSNAPSNNGHFLAFLVALESSSIAANDPSEYESVARNITERLGIPLGSLSMVDYIYGSSFDIGVRENTTTVILSAEAFEFPLTGCDLVGVTFDNNTNRVIAIQARPFVSLPPSINVSFEDALLIGKDAAMSKRASSEDRFKSDRVIGIRYVPVIRAVNPQPVPGDSGNTTYSSSLSIRLGFEYVADFVDSMYDPGTYPVLVVVDVVTGEVLLAPNPMVPIANHRYVLSPFILGTLIVSALIPLFIGAAIFVSPEFAVGFAGSFIVPLFMRLRGSGILDSFNRGRIYGYISAQPGCSFTDLKVALGIGNGTLAYHLMVLEKLELVSSAKAGKMRQYYPQGVNAPVRRDQSLGKTEAMVLNELITKGPLSTSSLAKALGISRQRVHYNARLLLRRGLAEQEGSLWKVESNPEYEEVN